MENPPKLPLGQNLPKPTLKDLCTEDKAKVGQIVQKIALEKATRQKSVERLSKDKDDLEKMVKTLKSEREKLLQESEYYQNSLSNSLMQIESYQNSQNVSVNISNFTSESKTLTPEPSFSVNMRDSLASICIQTSCDKEIQIDELPEKEISLKSPIPIRNDVKEVIAKAQETSMRLQKMLKDPGDFEKTQEFKMNYYRKCPETEFRQQEFEKSYENAWNMQETPKKFPSIDENLIKNEYLKDKGYVHLTKTRSSVEITPMQSKDCFYDSELKIYEAKGKGLNKIDYDWKFYSEDFKGTGKFNEKKFKNEEDDMIVIEDTFYDGNLLDVIEEMEAYEAKETRTFK
ncbi:hypothetical protein SteCoe_36056 [Stentor coeruleus]|uniref:Uncharacterized protein n=1 Tax=Stentor coeruleus TaxID=5963 RepID=A0A1R2AQZ0_9CILI|nr:hypothetical protein SteCoe_36056 [Stentor coeruleus]